MDALRTRWTAEGFRVTFTWRESERNQIAASAPTGSRSHLRAACDRAGSAASRTAAWRSTCRRFVISSGNTTSRATRTGCQPNRSLAMSDANRTFTSNGRSNPSTEPSSVLISTTSSVRLGSCHARMSMEPRSPKCAKLTSTSTSQAHRRSCSMTAALRRACPSSSMRSSAVPCHVPRISIRASSASKIASRTPTVTPAKSPRSTRETVDRETPASSPSSAWVMPLRRRTARIAAPSRRALGGATRFPTMLRSVATGTHRRLIHRHSPPTYARGRGPVARLHRLSLTAP